MSRIQSKIAALWYRKNFLVWLLLPMTLLFAAISYGRRLAYRLGLCRAYRAAVPVIVVGNLSVGGNGKTPVVIWLVEQLKAAGWKPGVVSRGYGGKSDTYPLRVTAHTEATECGDEPKLIAERCQVPVVVAPKRAAAVETLLQSGEVDLVISDDGLQHYALARDIELVVVDGERRFGNGHLLPMGPLREGLARLATVDAVICNGGVAQPGEFAMQLVPAPLVALVDSDALPPQSTETVDALAGIGHPPRFFATLQQAGFRLHEAVAYADHQSYDPEQLRRRFCERPLLMTQKDAVKCRHFALANWWYLPVNAELSPALATLIINKLKDAKNGTRS